MVQKWFTALDERTCPVCLGIAADNADGVPLGGYFQSDEGPLDGPPAHASCRCVLVIAPAD